MAAIVDPHRLPLAVTSHRPVLRGLAGGQLARPVSTASGIRPVAVLAVALLFVLVIAGVLALGRGAFAGLAPAPPAATSGPASSTSGPTVVVHRGDTLWSIARRLQPTGDVRALVDRLVAARGTAALSPGDRVAVPR